MFQDVYEDNEDSSDTENNNIQQLKPRVNYDNRTASKNTTSGTAI